MQQGRKKKRHTCHRLPSHTTTHTSVGNDSCWLPGVLTSRIVSCSTVVFKFPGGKSATRRFLPTELVQVLYDFCGSLGYDELRYQLCTSFPRASLDTKTITLAAADFTGRVALHCEEL
eukprot:m.148497 g.148497  ORF g.148497 m.148497 type:complete len:118 (-) comp17316_c0_seq2:140-493(-)